MKVSLNAIKWHGYGELFELPVDKLAEKIGAQLGALETEPEYLGAKYEGIVVAKVVSCEDHPNADKLHVCRIDDGGAVEEVERGEDGLIQVVCGAPNVRAGMTVAWLPPGATVPSSVDKEPFVLEVRELRGVKSNGMLASASELAINDDHSGLLEITTEDVGETLMKPGTPFKQLYGLDDYILEIENKMFTHRPDLFGLLGVGREIAGIQGKSFQSPNWYVHPHLPSGEGLALEVRNELPELVPRFMAVAMKDVTIKPSPVWLRSWLTRLGVRPINNIVDLTNYYMLLTGQPLHAYDYDKVKSLSGGDTPVIVVRNPHSDEKLTLLNGKELEPRAEAILIATDLQAIGLGGVMGGANTEVDNDTKNIILECATFDMYSIRRTAMAHGIFSDAVTRFTKGQSPLQNPSIIAKTAEDIVQLAGGRVASEVIDDDHLDASVQQRSNLFPPVTVSASFVNERLGLELSVNDMRALLENVEFHVHVEDDTLTIGAPFWRTDIELREDVVEEIGRLYGYDHLPLMLPKRDLTPAKRDALLALKDKLRALLCASGANEVLSYSFVHGDLLAKTGQDKDTAFRLGNALSPDLQYYRLSLMPSLLINVHPNIKAGYDQFALFEIGKSHSKDLVTKEGVPIEEQRLALVFAADAKAAKANYTGAPYYQARIYLMQLLQDLGIQPVFEPAAGYQPAKPVSKAAIAPFDNKRTSLVKTVDGQFIGELGEFTVATRRALKLPAFSAGFELDVAQLLKLQHSQSTYVAVPRYPKVEQDITLKLSQTVSFGEVATFFDSLFTTGHLKDTLPSRTICWFKPLDIYQGEDQDYKHVTWRFTIASYERTLTDKEVHVLLDAAATAAKDKFGAERL